jgi:exopolysaccharide biosynthesis polyprenyl glycosylphosphotransferase
MTPPPTAEAATAAPAVSTRRAVVVAPPPRVPRLTPARPAAVIVPPVAAYVGAIGAAAALESLFTGELWFFHSVRAVLLTMVALPAAYALRTMAGARGGPRLVRLVVPPASAIFVLGLDAALPGVGLHLWSLLAVWALSLAVPPLVRSWRDLWVRRRPARFTLLAPSEWAAVDAVRRLEAIPGLKIANAVIPGGEDEARGRLLRRPVAGDVDGSMHLEKRVVVSCPLKDPHVAATIARLVARGHHITSESAMVRGAEGRVDTHRADPLNLLLSRPRSFLHEAASRLLDVVLSATLLVVALPVMLVTALAIRLESKGPIFYRQRRVGFRGRLFHVVKFRSMRQDAEHHSGPVWAQRDDPRVTRVGRFLRRYRIDELPQLLNVLVGHMALVGPRPERPHFFEVLRRDLPLFELRTIVRPGITGWAQIRAPYAADFRDARTKLEYDLYYVTRRSPWFDVSILLETVGVALSGSGAR